MDSDHAMNPSLPPNVPDSDHYTMNKDPSVGSSDNVNEGLYLYITAAVGFLLNLVVITCILSCKNLRRMTNAFIIHGSTLDIIKCIYCIPFAQSLMYDVPPTFCMLLGGSYVVVVTASGFNIVAMICSEAYSFSENNVGGNARGSLCCVVFGIVMVYVGSVIIHLGPTIIGGDFKYNDLIGNCIFEYGEIKSYVVHAMWIAIMTLAMAGAIYYLVFFYRHVQSNSTHRLATLVRTTVTVSRGNTVSNQSNVQKVIRDSLSRARVLIVLTTLFILCWYPLFILTMTDPLFERPTKIYKLLTFIAWSNAAINPIVLILFDRNINICRRMACWRCGACDREDGEAPLMRPSTSRAGTLSRSSSTRNAGGLLTSATVYQRVGCRLCHEGQSHTGSTHCNGGFNKGVVRDTSMCELHNFSSS